ncbi:hypothetical protein [Streptomyces sp. NPDC048611]|uniref:hypothetical protein n=1 Tax=unclassified Streptomyces TaxID=2593676 RepID=UPI003428B1DF
MSEFSWPAASEVPEAGEVLRSWDATVAALPVGSHVSGRVIGRQPFGVFLRIDGVPSIRGLAEITRMPAGLELPKVGAEVVGVVVWHVEHNHQIKIELDEWSRQV